MQNGCKMVSAQNVFLCKLLIIKFFNTYSSGFKLSAFDILSNELYQIKYSKFEISKVYIIRLKN